MSAGTEETSIRTLATIPSTSSTLLAWLRADLVVVAVGTCVSPMTSVAVTRNRTRLGEVDPQAPQALTCVGLAIVAGRSEKARRSGAFGDA